MHEQAVCIHKEKPDQGLYCLQITSSRTNCILYFLGYKMKVFSFPKHPKNLDPACKMDLEFRDCFGREKIIS